MIINSNPSKAELQYAELLPLNTIRIPALTDPTEIKIYWFQCHYYKDDSSTFYFKQHTHTFFELHYILSGNITYLINNNEITVSEGHWLLIPIMTPHTLINCSPELFKIALSFEIIEDKNNPVSVYMSKTLNIQNYVFDKINKNVNDIIESIYSKISSRNSLTSFILRNLVFDLIAELVVSLENKKNVTVDNNIISKDETDTRFIYAKQFIDDNLYLQIKSQDVADNVHLSIKQLNRIFNKHGEKSVFYYIQHKKCLEIKSLLLESNLTLSEISDRLGFNDEFYFNRYFTKHSGITPHKFREINGKQLKNKQ